MLAGFVDSRYAGTWGGCSSCTRHRSAFPRSRRSRRTPAAVRRSQDSGNVPEPMGSSVNGIDEPVRKRRGACRIPRAGGCAMAGRLAASDRAGAVRIVPGANRRCSRDGVAPTRLRMVLVAAVILLVGLLEAASAQGVRADASQSGRGNEAQEALGNGVVGAAQPAWPLSDLTTIALWAPGEWRYLITAGSRRGQVERESLTRVDVMTRGETWKRTVGEEYTLHLSQTSEGSLVLPSEVAHGHNAVVQFEPPLSYLI